MGNKKIQMSRMWKYFTEATVEIIEEEGIDQVTIRKVADRAGYNSATIYNYFKEVSHLIFFASMKLLKEYTEEVSVYMNKGQTPLEKYILSWECFCKHSFKQPAIFHAIFIMDLGDHPETLIERYYEMYPSDLINIPDELKPILFERNVTKRGKSLLQQAAKEGQINEQLVDSLNEMTILLWQGMLTNILNNRMDYTLEEAEQKTMKYILQIIENAA
ncbi:TetR/AcrR family transcriptional regulator [Sporosarcina sp. F6_3S_P_2]|uniref:TetR/AcrR family transcriptional regulator n=1 Tax=Sporosarcina highlanderae TaxID=3035916 RepID=A0ABT8JMS3_9BACL|nr:TetR/AcrR family transcriptional regulator [Sporosarcina highlanderae]MDN4605866.1 TetR/AcrR family transcriptional regulator [Sporosarcina highlanderae]